MDLKAVSTKITDATKTAADRITNTLDALSPVCAPFAARWDAEADRRRQLRTPEHLKALLDAQRAYNSARSTASTARSQRQAARRATSNPLAAERRAARTADRAARRHRREARSALREARRSYPLTMGQLAARAHAVHAVPAAGLTAVGWEHVGAYPASVSAALIALNCGALWLGRRQPRVQVEDGLSAEERRLVERLDPSYWVAHADERGLSGTVPSPAEVTPAGLVSHVRLDGRWTPKSLRARADEIRALLGARTDLRMEITAGSHGDRATITLRTRSAADGIDLTGWEPGAPWGVDTVTGEPVHVPLGRRMLVAGTSGSGKSWSTRAILAEASETEDHRLVVIDPKRVEAINWQHRARVAVTPDEVLEVTDELYAEMVEREQLIPRGHDVIAISRARPRITVFVDEGAEVIAMAQAKGYDRIIDNLRSIARRARAAEIILIWATQKPTMSGEGHGIDSQIAGQITYRASLALSSASESQVVFGQDAHERGWHAHDLPMPGYALLRSHPKARPHHIRTRAMSPQDVIALPERPVWRRESAPAVEAAPTLAAMPSPAQAAPDERPALRLVKDGDVLLGRREPAPAAEAGSAPVQLTDSEAKVLAALVAAAGPQRHRDLVEATDMAKATVSKALSGLTGHGLVVRDGQTYTATSAAKGVSA